MCGQMMRQMYAVEAECMRTMGSSRGALEHSVRTDATHTRCRERMRVAIEWPNALEGPYDTSVGMHHTFLGFQQHAGEAAAATSTADQHSLQRVSLHSRSSGRSFRR